MGAGNAEVEVESFLEKVIPLYRHIDLSIESVAGGIYRCRIPLNDKTKNPLETVHAAIQFASAEVLGGLVVSSNCLGDGLFIAVRGASIEFHRFARTEIVAEAHFPDAEVARIRAELESAGEADFEVRSVIRDASGAEVASTVGRYVVRLPRTPSAS